MLPAIPLAEILITLAGSLVTISLLFFFQATRILGVFRRIISRTYRSPTFIIIVLAVFASISYIFIGFGLIERYLDEIFIFIFSITISTYVVAAMAYGLTESPAEISDPQPPLGWIGSVSIGAPGTLVGEFLQVMGVFQVSKVLIAGITFGQWNITLSFLNSLLMNVIAIALAAAAAASVAVRWLKLSEDWDNVMEELGVGPSSEEMEDPTAR